MKKVSTLLIVSFTCLALSHPRLTAQSHALPPPVGGITVDQVIRLSKSGLSDAVIIAQIKKRPTPFDPTPEQLLALKNAQVSDQVIAAMTVSPGSESRSISGMNVPRASSLDSEQSGDSERVQDVNQFVGKRVVVQRMPLCEPGTFNTVIAYAGKGATVLSAKPSKMLPALSQSVLARMPPEARALVEDQQKAATVLVQLDDDTKLDTCAPIGPARISEYFELADGETVAAIPAPAAYRTDAMPVQMPTMETLSKTEVESALAGSGKGHYVQINDAGLMAAGGALGTLPHITLFMPEAIIAIKDEQAKKQFLSYQPSEDDRKRLLTIFAQGYIGQTYQEGCVSVTRVVLLSSPSGGVVEEAYSEEAGTDAWANGFGATNYCQWLRATFSMAAVKRAQAAAQEGEFYVAVFAGTQNTKTYKIKHKHQAKLGLN